MKSILLFTLLLLSFTTSLAQDKKQKVVWDISSEDTTVQAAVFRQVNNARAILPDLQVEVVFHGKALFSVMADSTQFRSRVVDAKDKGVQISACNNSLKRLKIDPSKLMKEIVVIPSAVAEFIVKQSEGWSYIKAGH